MTSTGFVKINRQGTKKNMASWLVIDDICRGTLRLDSFACCLGCYCRCKIISVNNILLSPDTLFWAFFHNTLQLPVLFRPCWACLMFCRAFIFHSGDTCANWQFFQWHKYLLGSEEKQNRGCNCGVEGDRRTTLRTKLSLYRGTNLQVDPFFWLKLTKHPTCSHFFG